MVKGEGYGPEADVWSCGVCLFFIMSGGWPYKVTGDLRLLTADSSEKVLEKALERGPVRGAADAGQARLHSHPPTRLFLTLPTYSPTPPLCVGRELGEGV